jgi:hypothetical protein
MVDHWAPEADGGQRILNAPAHASVDFNGILKIANLIVAGLMLFAFSQFQGNGYIDGETVALGILLCIQTQIALSIERRRRDAFVILLAFDMIFFFAVRIVTLTVYPFSAVFDRYNYGVSDSNYALIFILIANTVLYAGLYLAGSRRIQSIDAAGWRAKSPLRAVLLMVAAIIFAYFSKGFWNSDNIPRAFGFLSIFLAPSITILMTLSYYLLFRKSLSRKFAFAIVVLLVADAAIHTLSGSRSAILVVVQNLIIVSLAIFGSIKFRRRNILIGVAMLPAVSAMLVATFVISTYNRSAQDAGSAFDFSRAVDLAVTASDKLTIGADMDLLLPPIAARAGYFDFSAEIIAHRDQYATVLNLSSYAKSIVDNLLTPGFDVYDQPKISNALRFVYDGGGAPSKELVVDDNYQSDQFGIYGEFYGLFGYACLPLLFVVAVAFKRSYANLRYKNPFNLALKRAIVLFAFAWTIDSYGIDWNILQALPLVVAMFIYAPFFASEPLSLGSDRARVAAAAAGVS